MGMGSKRASKALREVKKAIPKPKLKKPKKARKK
jgi:hypothetical protein